MIWLRAIGVNLKAAFEDFIAFLLMVILMAVVVGIMGGVLFAVGWVINFFGPLGVLIAMGLALSAFLIAGLVEFVRNCYQKVKETKERLEILDRYK